MWFMKKKIYTAYHGEAEQYKFIMGFMKENLYICTAYHGEDEQHNFIMWIMNKNLYTCTA